MIEDNKKRYIFDEATFLAYGFSWVDILEITNIDDYPAGKIIKIETGIQFLKNLRAGGRGQDVKELQKFLNNNGFRLTETGLGSPGQGTEFFGKLTYQALIKFQNHYRKEILTPLGLYWGNGYFGSSTRAFANSINK
ncbi:peptidoglycan-binding protein [Candidatus Parcubacteria bacterium]|nr:peptidoglycan-binding protein [Candidatus Parcubacteria bacterium]